MGGGLVFLMLEVDADSSCAEAATEIQLVFLPEHWSDGGARSAILGLLRPGVVAQVSYSRSDVSADLHATSASVVRLNADVAAVTRAIELVCAASPLLTVAEVATALGCEEVEVQELQKLHLSASATTQQESGVADGKKRTKESGKYLFRQAVLSRCRLMQGLPPVKLGRQRGPHLHKRDLDVLDAAEAKAEAALKSIALIDLTAQEKEQCANAAEEFEDDDDRDEASSPPDDLALLGSAHPSFNLHEPDRKSRRGPMLMRDYAHGKKGPQVCWFVSRIRDMFPSELSSATGQTDDCSDAAAARRVIQILDVGGGRGDLGISVATVFRGKCHVTVVDKNERSLVRGRERADSLGLGECMSWICCGVSDLCVDQLKHIDLVLGLHTCGGLTDAILNLASQLQAQRLAECVEARPPVSFLVCPCCFYKHSDLRPSRCWASAHDSGSVETLTRLAESDNREVSLRAMTLINAARLKVAQTEIDGVPSALQYKLLSFPASYSTRNLVLQAVSKKL
eukprot:TRINITY_DN25849_c0_g1_i1.p1 TRINITY_DN25849_c0_g1~~TRINITY_DN25849_c0_g1_i1.p1  ORF type:complete len:511 (+),score=68.35 TRINITY_DN25849_c0_g1_i1:80-1612(+)